MVNYFFVFFYDKQCVGYAKEFVTMCGSTTILTGFKSVKYFQSKGENNKSWVGSVNFIDPGHLNYLFLTPYLANVKHLQSLKPAPKRILTLRPAQGQQSDGVYIDFVKGRFSRFLTNSMMVVALSRFCVHQVINFVPHLPKRIEFLFHGFVYVDSYPISQNYQRFVDLFLAHTSCHFDIEPLKGIRVYDVNENFFLKWWFFLALVEHILHLMDKLDYSYDQTCFGAFLVMSSDRGPD